MATDLDVSTATFGTASLLLASGDPITDDTGSAWGGQVAQNTGWLYYQPRNIAARSVPSAASGTTYYVGNSWMRAGTYSIYGHLSAEFAGGGGDGTSYWDGTLLATIGATGAATGSLCGWIAPTDTWVEMKFAARNTTATGITASYAMRFGSYAP